MGFVRLVIKILVSLTVLVAALGAALFWLPTGGVLLPVIQHFGARMVPSINLTGLQGSLHQGYQLQDLTISSGDEVYLSLSHVAVSPDWGLTLAGRPWPRSLSLEGLSLSLDGIDALTEAFAGDEVSEDEAPSEGFPIDILPLDLSVRDVTLTSPQGNLVLSSLILSRDGPLSARADLQAEGRALPLEMEGRLDFEPLRLTSSLRVGEGGGSIKGQVEPPFDLRCDLTALSLGELLSLLPEGAFRGQGRLDGRVFLKGWGADLTASGVVSMPRGSLMDVPLSFRLPWDWNGQNFTLDEAVLRTKAASLSLNASLDFEELYLTARGGATNISLGEIGRIAAPEAGLSGEGGVLRFDLALGLNHGLEDMRGDFTARLPEVSAAGVRLVKGFTADAVMTPGQAPKISCGGEIFGGKLFGRGESDFEGKHPQAVVSLVGLDLKTLAAAFPDLAVVNPSGKVTLTARLSAPLSVKARLTSDKLSASGLSLQDLETDLLYEKGKATLNALTGKFAKGTLFASGVVGIEAQTLDLKAGLKGLDPRAIPQIEGQFQGLCDLDVAVGGTFTDPRLSAQLRGRNNSVSGLPLGNLNLAVNYAEDRLDIPATRISLPGGAVSLEGALDLKGKEPRLNLSALLPGLDLGQLSRALKLKDPVKGTIRGRARASGLLSTAEVTLGLEAKGVDTLGISVPSAILDIQGSMRKLDVRKLEAQVNPVGPKAGPATLRGRGSLVRGRKDIKDSAVNLDLDVRDLELRPLLEKFAGSAPVAGVLDGTASLRGTLGSPRLSLRIRSPLSAGQMLIDSLTLEAHSPATDHYVMNASGAVKGFKLTLDGDLIRKGKAWDYTVSTRPLGIADLLKAFAPEAAGMAEGFAVVSVSGSAPGSAPIRIQANLPKLTALDKVTIQDITLPLTYQDNKVRLRDARASLCGGEIRSEADVDLDASDWKGSLRVRDLDMGRLAAPFLPEGELVGSADLTVRAKGSFSGVFADNFAEGSFTTSSGYLHKMALLNRVTPTKRLSFENVRGTFFWNGSDLFLNPGCQATAGFDEPLYRYFAVNGSMGLPGKGLRLLCNGRFDLKILDRVFGAMKGLFQYMTGGLTGNGSFLRDAASRVLGVQSRDFQNVSFTLANSWDELRLLDLKVDKSIKDFLPIDRLNKEEEQKKDDRQFQLHLKFPAGPGGKSPEDETTQDQFKKQFIDNLFSIGS